MNISLLLALYKTYSSFYNSKKFKDFVKWFKEPFFFLAYLKWDFTILKCASLIQIVENKKINQATIQT